MATRQRNHLTQGAVSPKLISLTIPMIFGMLSMVVFNLVDTFFVSRLGTKELAAMGFNFPAVMFIVSIALGFGVAAASLVSRAIGRGDEHQVQRLATDSIIVSLFVVVICSLGGLLTMDLVFGLLGAQGEILSLVKEYMSIWYLGVAFIVIPMVGNNTIRACGDTFTPSLIMIIAMLVNVILDPLLIFGLWGFPRLELKGAALATVIARAVSMVCSLYVLFFRKKLIDLHLPPLDEFVASVKQIFYIGIPTAAARLLMPVAMAVIMGLVATFGAAAVAAYGVTLKVEMFVFIVVMALATALIPFIGQNWGARNVDRVRQALRTANTFTFWWGMGVAVAFFLIAVPVGHIFGKDVEVKKYITFYLWVVPISYGLRGCTFLVASAFTAINKPLVATALNIVRMFVVSIPCALIGKQIAGLEGLFIGLCLGNMTAGAVALIMERWIFRAM